MHRKCHLRRIVRAISGQQRRAAARTNGSRFDHVSNCESLDRLIFWSTSRAIGAADGLDVTSPFLVSSTVVYSAFQSAP